MSDKQKLFIIKRLIALIIFLGILLYPTVSDSLSRINNSEVISSYEESTNELDKEKKEEILNEARLYNSSLLENSVIYDPFSENSQSDDNYLNLLKTPYSDSMGTIQIPCIAVKLPIYHTVKPSVLQNGVGHMEGTSLPIGGENTHAVLSGHRGLPSSMLFTDLDKMQIGDIFYINILGITNAYKVDQIKIVLPTEISEIKVVENKDYVTLVTCTPYSVNTHRLLVRGERIPYEEAVVEAPESTKTVTVHIPLEIKALLCAFAIIFIGIFIVKRRIV